MRFLRSNERNAGKCSRSSRRIDQGRRERLRFAAKSIAFFRPLPCPSSRRSRIGRAVRLEERPITRVSAGRAGARRGTSAPSSTAMSWAVSPMRICSTTGILRRNSWDYRRWDLNPHPYYPDRILSPARLPFRHFGSQSRVQHRQEPNGCQPRCDRTRGQPANIGSQCR